MQTWESMLSRAGSRNSNVATKLIVKSLRRVAMKQSNIGVNHFHYTTRLWSVICLGFNTGFVLDLLDISIVST